MQSMDLKVFIYPSHIANCPQTAWESMGYDRHPIRAWGIFHCLIQFAYVQQVSLLLKGTTQKSVLWYKFYIGNYKENL